MIHDLRRKPRPSVSKVKNQMRRLIAEILQPSPSGAELSRMWAHFEARCAYCLKSLEPSGRWHLDHVSPSQGNYIGNRVPACPSCNGDEKRERAWREFIGTKLTGSALDGQVALINRWLDAHIAPTPGYSREVREVLHEVELAVHEFERKCAQLKATLRKSPPPIIDHAAQAQELRDDFVRVSTVEDTCSLEVATVEWVGVHTPELRWQLAAQLPRDASAAAIECAIKDIIADERFFRTCKLCGERNNRGHMSDEQMCDRCAEERGVIH